MRNDISVVCTGGQVPGRVPGTSGARDGGSKTGASRDPTARASGSGKCVAGLGYTQGGKNGSGHVMRRFTIRLNFLCPKGFLQMVDTFAHVNIEPHT